MGNEPKHQKYYQGMYHKQCLLNEELQAKCNIFAGIALTCLLICVMMLVVVGVVLFG